MDETALWSKHLAPGETIVWSATVSARLWRAEIARKRWMAVLLFLVSAALFVGFGWKFTEAINQTGTSADLGVAIALPLYGLFGLTFGIVALAQLGRLNPRLASASHYAATTTRLLAANANGEIIDQIDMQEIAGLVMGGRRSAPDIFVLRSHDDVNVKTFAIEHIDSPLEAKAIIEEKFLETTP